MKRTIEFPEGVGADAIKQMEEMEKRDAVGLINTICFWLIKQCNETNAETMTITQEGMFAEHGDKKLGDWKITVKKLSPTIKQ